MSKIEPLQDLITVWEFAVSALRLLKLKAPFQGVIETLIESVGEPS